MIKTVYRMYKDIRQSRLCSASLEASSGQRPKVFPINNQRARVFEALCPLRFGQITSYSPQRLVSQSASEGSLWRCEDFTDIIRLLDRDRVKMHDIKIFPF